MPTSCPLCDQDFRPGDPVCSHSGCAARFHKACYLQATIDRTEIVCPVCDRCWVFVRDERFAKR